MAKLTKKELRVIELTKRQGLAERPDEQTSRKPWVGVVKSLLLFLTVFLLFAFMAYMVFRNGIR